MISVERREEIQLVTDAITLAAKQCPSLRIGQLIDNAIVSNFRDPFLPEAGPDLFNITDGQLIAALLDYVQ